MTDALREDAAKRLAAGRDLEKVSRRIALQFQQEGDWPWEYVIGELKEVAHAAFNAGAEKMREEAARYADKRCDRNFGNEIRNLPRPEYGEKK